MAYYTVPCGLITTVFSLTLSSLVIMPNLGRGGLSNYTTIVKLEVRTKQKNKKVQQYFHSRAKASDCLYFESLNPP